MKVFQSIFSFNYPIVPEPPYFSIVSLSLSLSLSLSYGFLGAEVYASLMLKKENLS